MGRWIACTIVTISSVIVASAFASEISVNPTAVKVRIQSQAAVTLSGRNIRLIGLEKNVRAVGQPSDQEVQIRSVRLAEKVHWQIRRPQGLPKELLTSQEFLMIQGERMHEGRTHFPNRLILRAGSRNKIDIIGLVPLEEYVLAVLINEMPATWPIETLKAQAIAIRSFTLAVMRERAQRTFHVESTVLDQVYKKAHNLKPELLEKAQAAVKTTEGMTLLNLKSRPLKAFYHSDCGGKTVSASSVWNTETDSDVGTATDDSCGIKSRSRWSLRMDRDTFATLAREFSGALRSNEFRRRVGFMELKSTNFEINMHDASSKVEFVGRGFGHGVGLCQWGSRALGLKGFTYEKILNHYYPMALLSKTTMVNPKIASQARIND